jgi:hypothetical protein
MMVPAGSAGRLHTDILDSLMKALLHAAVALLLVALAAEPATAQAIQIQGGSIQGLAGRGRLGRRADQAAPTGTGHIRGTVLSADRNSPVRLAQVRLAAPDIGFFRVTPTDAEGRYHFADLPAGRYTLTASKGGYVTLQYGQRRPFEPGQSITLGDDQLLAGANVLLPRGSVIAGRVTDEYCDPVAQAAVSPLRYQYGPGGQRRLQPAGTPRMTDDLGQYRLYGLMPGDYVVSATMRSGMPFAGGQAAAGDATDGYATTFFPGTTSVAEASPISVGLGQEAAAYFSLLAGRTTRISGIVIDSQGTPASGGRVILRSGEGAGIQAVVSASPVQGDGGFTLSSVPPGEHALEVLLAGRGRAARPEFARMPLTASGADITALVITTTSGASAKGKVTFEGGPRGENEDSEIAVVPSPVDQQATRLGARFGGRQASGRVDEENTFQLGGLFGRIVFRVSVQGVSEWALKSVRLDGRDVTDTPIDFAGTESLSGLEIIITNRATEVVGTVRDSRGDPLTDFVVVLLPLDLPDGSLQTRFVRSARPDQEGRFRIKGLPGGRYVAAAVEALEQGSEWDPDFQAHVRAIGSTVSLSEGRTETLDLALTTR